VVGRRRAGFTLVETLIALVLSSVVMALVSHTFLVQNRYYATQTLRTGVQDNVRSATELMAREIRTAMEDGVMVAGPRTIVVRSPVSVVVVCSKDAGTGMGMGMGMGMGSGAEDFDVYNEGGELALDAGEVAGVASRNRITGSWDTASTTWSYIKGGGMGMGMGMGGSGGNCADGGADTAGVAANFHQFTNFNTLLPSSPEEGDVVMLFRETTYKIQTSVLDATTLGLFRGVSGSALVEFATGVDTLAQFQYRTGGSTYADTIFGAALADIDAIRIVADARKQAPTGGADDITFGWAVNIALRNNR
jgi:prepilin-type N-terminal cleavage/methylation domain-containing protein